jgi:hypothetical protein
LLVALNGEAVHAQHQLLGDGKTPCRREMSVARSAKSAI